jgi:hypothetical protein
MRGINLFRGFGYLQGMTGFLRLEDIELGEADEQDSVFRMRAYSFQICDM